MRYPPNRIRAKAGIGLLCGLWIVLACAPIEASTWESMKQQIREKFPRVEQIETTTLAAWLADEEREPPLLLDVREEEEFSVSHLPGAIWAPDLQAAEKALGAAPGSAAPGHRAVVAYCSVGYRSSRIADQLREHGYEHVYNLEGSLFEWANLGNAVVRGDSIVTEVHPYDRKWSRFLDQRYWPKDWKKRAK